MKLNGFYGYIRIRLPDSFYKGITAETDAQALGVMVLNKLSNSAGNDANRPVSQPSAPSATFGSRSPPSLWLQAKQEPRQLEDPVEEALAEVGMYTDLKDLPLFSAFLWWHFSTQHHSLLSCLLLLRNRYYNPICA